MDRIAVSGTVDAGSIPAWSANVHTPLPYLGPPRCACAEIVRQRGVLVSVVICRRQRFTPLRNSWARGFYVAGNSDELAQIVRGEGVLLVVVSNS